MFKEVVELFKKLVAPEAIYSKIIHDSNIPADIMNTLYMTKKIELNPDYYYKIEENDDIVMILYSGLYDSHKTAFIDDIMIYHGKPTLFIIMDSDIVMKSSDEAVITSILAASFSVVCFLKAKCASFLYNEEGTIGKVFKEAPIVLFIAFTLSVFRMSEDLEELMLQSIQKMKLSENFTKDDLYRYIQITNYGVEFVLDNSGIGDGDSKNE